jgi:glycosidase
MKHALYFITLYITLICPPVVGQVNRIEPLNWWTGMKNTTLQLLVQGNGVGEMRATTNYPGVTILKQVPGDSKNYLFVDLEISAAALPGTMVLEFTGLQNQSYQYPYQLLQREQMPESFVGFNGSDVVYLVVPDRFSNGDTTNDRVEGTKEQVIDRSFPGGRHGGDLRGIINHLPYLSDLGITALWLTPVLENNMETYSYHGYSITNHYRVDPRYGSLNDYKELSATARTLGIKLIFDEVLNHIGSNYWWMQDLPFKDWLNYAGSHTATNHSRTTNQDIHASSFDKDLMHNGWFDKTMPDMNGSNSYVANYLIQNTIWWIETLQLGGVREDTYGYSNKEFLSAWSCQIMNEYPLFNIVGEEWSYNPLITSYWQSGVHRQDGYESCLKTVMDFPLQEALVASLNGRESASYLPAFNNVYESLANDFIYANPNNIMVLGDNHDMDRLFMQLNQDTSLMKMALTFLLTTRGIPQIYYGTEVLMDNTGHHKVDGLIRADFPGGWHGDTVNAFTGSGLSPKQKDMQYFLQHFLQWRKKKKLFAHGKLLHFFPTDGCYTFFRYDKGEKIMVVINHSKEATLLDLKRFNEILQFGEQAENVMTGEKMVLSDYLVIPARKAIVLDFFPSNIE